jgi:hypothetical protein
MPLELVAVRLAAQEKDLKPDTSVEMAPRRGGREVAQSVRDRR